MTYDTNIGAAGKVLCVNTTAQGSYILAGGCCDSKIVEDRMERK